MDNYSHHLQSGANLPPQFAPVREVHHQSHYGSTSANEATHYGVQPTYTSPPLYPFAPSPYSQVPLPQAPRPLLGLPHMHDTSQAPCSDCIVNTTDTNFVAVNGGGDASMAAPELAAPLGQYAATASAPRYESSSYPVRTGPSMTPAPSMAPMPSMAPPPPPMPPPTTSARSATSIGRHRSRAARMLSRTRGYIGSTRERTGEAEVHWSEVDEEGTWVLMFVPAQRGYDF
ncbi:unnamed protein product [Peniophora sp. CBMAI 1063]|nr:unnamed protein product [Peniophora sp. CBMAI 1063]